MRLSKRTSLLALTSIAAVAALTLAGCSNSTESSLTSPAPATSAAVPQPGASGAMAPFATTDCAVSGPPTAAESAPVDGQEFEGIVVQTSDTGAPMVTIPVNAAPVTDLKSFDLATGSGDQVKSGSTLTVNYCGIGLASRTLFDSSWERGEPATFPLDGLIQGWIDGLPGMAVGGERLLLIPGSLAYGPNPPDGSGIGPDETLLFIVQVTDIS